MNRLARIVGIGRDHHRRWGDGRIYVRVTCPCGTEHDYYGKWTRKTLPAADGETFRNCPNDGQPITIGDPNRLIHGFYYDPTEPTWDDDETKDDIQWLYTALGWTHKIGGWTWQQDEAGQWTTKFYE